MTPPQAQLKPYIGQVASGGNPGVNTQRSTDASKIGGLPIDVGINLPVYTQAAGGGEASIYSYLFRNPNAAAAYISIYNVPANQVKPGVTPPIGRLQIPGTSNFPNQLIGPQLFAPYYYGATGLSFLASTADADSSVVAPALPIYYELTWA
jgi:hypothetical protein